MAIQLKDTGERAIEDENSWNNPNYIRHIAVYNFARQRVKDKVILDSGSGSGYGSFYLISNGASRVVGIDMSQEAVQYAKERYKHENLEFEKSDVSRTRFPDETFDVVTSFQVIEHLEDANRFLAETRRVLKKPGLALISTPNKQTYSPNTPHPENPFHKREYYLDEFGNLLRPYFSNVEILGLSQSKRAEEFTQKVVQADRFVSQSRFLTAIKRFIPKPIKRWLSPVRGQSIDISDFTVSGENLESCLDFIAVCKKT